MGWLIALGILTLIAFMPIGALVQYDSRGFLVRIIAGWFRLTVYPMKKRKKKQAKEPGTSEELQKKQEQKKTPQPQSTVPSDGVEKGGSLQDFLPLVRLVLNFMDRFRKSMRINHLRLKLILAGDDPCDLAVNYGRACAAVANLMPQLERALVIKKRHVWVGCDFEGDQTLIYGRLDLTITLGRIVWLAVRYGIRALRVFLKINKQRKGGATS